MSKRVLTGWRDSLMLKHENFDHDVRCNGVGRHAYNHFWLHGPCDCPVPVLCAETVHLLLGVAYRWWVAVITSVGGDILWQQQPWWLLSRQPFICFDHHREYTALIAYWPQQSAQDTQLDTLSRRSYKLFTRGGRGASIMGGEVARDKNGNF